MNPIKRTIIWLIILSVALPLSSVTFPVKSRADENITAVTTEEDVLPPKGQKKELVSKRTLTSKTYLNDNGSKEMVASLTPIHYEVKNGDKISYEEIDNTIVDTLGVVGGKGYANKQNSFRLSFSKNLADSGIDIVKDGKVLNLELKSISNSENGEIKSDPNNIKKADTQKANNKLTYKNVAADTDIEYQATNTGLKENIILQSYSGQNKYVYEISATGLYFETSADGVTAFFDQTTKQPVYQMPVAFMRDSNITADNPEGVISYAVKTEISQKGNKFDVALTADPAWLSLPERVFPIVIDPTINATFGYGEDSYIQSGYPNTNSWDQSNLYVGMANVTVGSTTYYKGSTRTLTPFFYDDLTNARIINATFNAYQFYCSSGSNISTHLVRPFEVKTVTWNNQPAISDSVGSYNDCGTGKWISANVTTAAKYWYEWGNPAGFQKGALEFIQDDESSWAYHGWKAENGNAGMGPQLHINYEDYNATYAPDTIYSPKMDLQGFYTPVTVTNTGRNTWIKGQVNLSYHWLTPDGNLAHWDPSILPTPWDGRRTAIPNDMGHGQSATLKALVIAPPIAGTFILQWDLVHESVTWFSDRGVPTSMQEVAIEIVKKYDASYEVQTPIINMVAGSTTILPVVVTNKSRYDWTPENYSLGYHWEKDDGTVILNNPTTQIPQETPKYIEGGRVTVPLQVKAPVNGGNYKLKLDMNLGGVYWFSIKWAVPTYDINNVTVTPASFSSLTHLGTESYYAKAGPVDLATGNLSYSSTDLSVPSNSGTLTITRSYNSKTLEKSYTADADGFVHNWLFNGPYKAATATEGINTSYLSNEATIRPSEGMYSKNNIWFTSPDQSANIVDINTALAAAKVSDNGSSMTGAIYASTYIFSPSARAVRISVGSDDGIKMWLNGQNLLTVDEVRTFGLDSNQVNADLNKGWNRLTLKVSQAQNDWKMAIRLLTQDTGAVMPDLTYALNNPDVFFNTKTMGKGWTFNFEEFLDFKDPENVYYRDGTGTVNIISKNPDGSYKKPTGTSYDLVQNTSGTFYLKDKAGFSLYFHSNGKIAYRLNPTGVKMNFAYDSQGRCYKIYNSTRYVYIHYTTDGRVTAVNDPLGNMVTYGGMPLPIGGSGFSGVIIYPDSKTISYTFDSAGKIVSYTNRNGFKTNIVYNNDQVSSLIDPLGNATTFAYDNKKVEITDALGRKYSAAFDDVNLLISSTNPKGYGEYYTYDSNYNLTQVIPNIPENDALFYRYTYQYDSRDNLIKSVDPMGNATTYAYNTDSDLITTTDPKQNITAYTYSTNGKRLLTSETDSVGNKTLYSYDLIGRLISTTDPKGLVSSSTYNGNSDLLTATTPKGEVTTFTYDLAGRKTTSKSSLGNVTTYSYDKVNQLAAVTDPAGLVARTEYDGDGNKIKEIDPAGKSKLFQYDAFDQLIKFTDEVGAVISYGYDKVGNKISMTDAKGKITTYVYDELNQLISETDPTGKVTRIEYDANGNATRVTDPSGKISTQTVNKNGDLTAVTDAEGTTNLNYDANGNVTSANTTVNSESMTVSYDKNDNVTSTTSNITGTISGQYDANGNTTAITTPAATVNFGYDADNAVTSVNTTTRNGLSVTNYLVKDAEGKLTKINKSNGDTADFSYDLSGRITLLSNKNRAGAVQKSYAYTYDAATNVATVTDNLGKVNTYQYDVRNQLIQENVTKYTYDINGNRLTKVNGNGTTSYVYDEQGDGNKLLSYSLAGKNTTFEYDANGNVTKKIDATGLTQYFYDSDNYFIKAILPSGIMVEYVYDKLTKLRIQRKETLTTGAVLTRNFVYDGDRLVAETTTTGAILRSYNWDEDENLISTSLLVNNVMKTYNYIKNAKGDITGMADQNGNVVVEYEYDAWGVVVNSKTLSTSEPFNLYGYNVRLYGGYWYDSTLGLYFMKTRMYNPTIGRFLSKDPVVSGIGALDQNPYIYCGNNPIDRVDPSGRGFFSAIKNFASGVVQKVTDAWNNVWNKVSNTLENVASKNILVVSRAASIANKISKNNGVRLFAATYAAEVAVAAVVLATIYVVIPAVVSTYISIAATLSSIAAQSSVQKWAAPVERASEHLDKRIESGQLPAGTTLPQYTNKAISVMQEAEAYGPQIRGGMLYKQGDWFTAVNGAGKILTSFRYDPRFTAAKSAFDYLQKNVRFIIKY